MGREKTVSSLLPCDQPIEELDGRHVGVQTNWGEHPRSGKKGPSHLQGVPPHFGIETFFGRGLRRVCATGESRRHGCTRGTV